MIVINSTIINNLILIHWMQIRTTTYDVRNPMPGLWHGYSKREKGDTNIKNTKMFLNGWTELVSKVTRSENNLACFILSRDNISCLVDRYLPFCPLSLIIVLSFLLWFTTSDYPPLVSSNFFFHDCGHWFALNKIISFTSLFAGILKRPNSINDNITTLRHYSS